ncbi:hypothetical protein JR316_0006634 [Psilocybe cubensis]|uniref:Uncharacterized protein n=1 Tax=Psilocybe cubensis TaxID=181762 RepID=A0ACB8GX63_PSICU|nr:hypothetical protein JR316_0006634 [Psilocybe cubensis]KAH9480037.1 hypothetical protein JR316_0006634 [Psilocybe cubensis]
MSFVEVQKYGIIKAKVKEFTDSLYSLYACDGKHPFLLMSQSWVSKNVVAQQRIIYIVEETLMETWKPRGTHGGGFTHEDIRDLESMIPPNLMNTIIYHHQEISPAATPSPPSSPSTVPAGRASVQQRRDSPGYEEPMIMLGDMDMGNSSGSENGGHSPRRSSQR